jgi:2-furoyl-CoA dehydrogenase large subunit
MSVPACLANAVADAIKPLGTTVKHLPLLPNDIWQLIREAEDGGAK